jgi:hypothetical protein
MPRDRLTPALLSVLITGIIACGDRPAPTAAGPPRLDDQSWAFPLARSTSALRVLLLSDLNGPTTDALAGALAAAGFDVTVRPAPEYTWDATDPPLDEFTSVVHLNGVTFSVPLSLPSQVALVEFVRSGGGYVASQWNGLELFLGLVDAMADLMLQSYDGDYPLNCSNCDVTWTAEPLAAGHPVLSGVPDEFTFSAEAHDAGPLVEFDTQPSTVLMRSMGGGPAVIVREFGDGGVVSFSNAANGPPYVPRTLLDPNIQQLYVNAVRWASLSGRRALEILIDDIADLVDSGDLKQGQATALITKLEQISEKIENGQINAARNQLVAFINQVEGLIPVQLPAELGEPLIEVARVLIDRLDDG